MFEDTARRLDGWLLCIKQASGRPLVAFAGRAFMLQSELQSQVPGVYLGDTIQVGLARLEERLLR